MKRKIFFLLVIFALIGSSMVFAANPNDWIQYAQETLTVSTTTVGLTNYGNMAGYQVKALMVLKTADITFTLGGGAPITQLKADQNLNLDSASQIEGFRAIRAGATDGVLGILYFRRAAHQ